MAKFVLVNRIDSAPRIIFVAGERFDPEGNIVSGETYDKLKDRKDFKEYVANKTFEVEVIDSEDKKSIEKAIKKIKSKKALEVANDLLGFLDEEDEEEAEDSSEETVDVALDGGSDLIGLTFEELKEVIEKEGLDCSIQSNWSMKTNAEKIVKARKAE